MPAAQNKKKPALAEGCAGAGVVWGCIWLPGVSRSDMLIVGDSLTSDMKGGLAAGIPTCWYNPQSFPRPADMAIAFEIQNLQQIYELL